MDFFVRSRRRDDHDAGFNAMLCSIPSVRVPSAGLMAPVPMDDDDESDGVTTIETPPKKKKQQCGAEYDTDIDATFRVMETDPAERPSPDYLSDTQGRDTIITDRAELVAKMHRFSRHYHLAPGALHHAVSYVDRFLSVKKITGRGRDRDRDRDRKLLLLLGAVAVFAAAKYEDRNTCWRIDADAVAVQEEEEEGVPAVIIRSLAHHLADMALLDYRCVAFLPSAVAASAILLAKLGYSTAPVAGYEVEDLRECVEAIYDMHDNLQVWPGCAQMMEGSLPPPYMLTGMH